jgi:hypothetical protein
MSDAIAIAAIGAAGLVLAAGAPVVVTILTARAARKDRAMNDNRANTKLDQIHTLTNSTLTAANKRIEVLEGIVARLTEEKGP